ncbi:MAG TPA: hypothetical protein VFQ61_25325 [Polyangiaceae bacterium]|nr:hypothetical protein [Polyangiaceae bacterium]
MNLRAVLLLAISSAACAPVASLRAPYSFPEERRFELGGGVASLGKRPYVEESTQFTGQVWGTYQPRPWLAVSAIGAFDDSAAAGGLAARVHALRSDRLALSPEVEAGYAWVATSLGLAARVFEHNWLYASPRVGNLGSAWTVFIPVGVNLELYRGLGVRGEASLSYAELKYYNLRRHFAAAVFYQF